MPEDDLRRDRLHDPGEFDGRTRDGASVVPVEFEGPSADGGIRDADPIRSEGFDGWVERRRFDDALVRHADGGGEVHERGIDGEEGPGAGDERGGVA